MHASHPIAEHIVKWYKRNKRDLPWRKTRDPYLIWVSEVMLQQTQVETVIPYYERFTSHFSTIEDLAKASLQDVLKIWENMGYYSRGRNLHEAAKIILHDHGGIMPGSRETLLALPGIGPYTAAAILSFAFGNKEATVDGNVRRILSRLFLVQDPLDQSRTQKRINDLAEDLVPEKTSGLFNQGLMDLGSTVCTPRKPSCPLCPVKAFCGALQKGLQAKLPVKRRRGPLPHREMTAGIIYDPQGRLLIVRRPNEGLLGGLWKFPGGERLEGKSLKDSVRETVRLEAGIGIEVKEMITSVKHAYTHFRITLYAYRCLGKRGKLDALDGDSRQWVSPESLKDFPFSKADRKIMAAL